MNVPSAGTTSQAGTAGSSQTSDTKPSQQVDYLKLIVAQMQNMNPMDPSSGQDSMPEMMQAESLNQLTTLNKAITQLQTLTQTSYAASLLGRGVSGKDETGAAATGTVTGMHSDPGGVLLTLSSGKTVRLADVTDVNTAQGTASA